MNEHADRDHSEVHRLEEFVELLPPQVGHNRRHFRAAILGHMTSDDCPCGPERISHSGEPVAGPALLTIRMTDEPGTSHPAAARATPAQVGTDGNQRGPDGYRCCKHCAEDDVHDVETDSHDVVCQTCDDPSAMLRDRVAELERSLADERAKVARVEAYIASIWAAGPGCGENVPSVLHAIEAALAGPEPTDALSHVVQAATSNRATQSAWPLAGPEPEATEAPA